MGRRTVLRRALKIAAFASALAVARLAEAAIIPDPSYEAKTAESDVVIVGRVDALGAHRWNIDGARARNLARYGPPGPDTIILEGPNAGPGPAIDEMATVTVRHVLKGRPPRRLRVLSTHTIVELDPDCCDIGETYVFFLELQDGDVYAPVSGRAGVIPLMLELRESDSRR